MENHKKSKNENDEKIADSNSKHKTKLIKEEINEAQLRMKKAKVEEVELKLKQAKQKLQVQKQNNAGKFGTESEPRKSLSTYLRNQNKFEVSAIAILDRKASILIKMCPTIISGLIILNDYIMTNVMGGRLITIILLIGLLTSLILAIISIKPASRGFGKIVNKHIKPLSPEMVENLFYVWEIDSFEEYQKGMEEVVKSQDLQLGNQIRANFILGKSNVRIADFIDYAYNVFLLSFVLAGLVFLVASFGII
jgi:hypothetical protein